MIVVDTEYTTWPGALENGWSAPGQHREVVQIAALRVDENFVVQDRFNILVRPRVNPVLSDLFIKLTTLTQEQVDRDGVAFPDALQAFSDFCRQYKIICMNADEAVFRENCRLNDVAFSFPASWHRLRPFLEKNDVDVKTHASGDLHKLTPAPLATGHTHLASHDVESMACWLAHAKKTGVLKTLSDLPTGAPTQDPRSHLTLVKS